MSQTLARTDRFVARVCRDSYYEFFLHFWPEAAAEKLNRAWYIKELCDQLQEVAERVFLGEPRKYDLVWNCPPGTTKSSCVSVLWQPWIWTRMPSARFISGSYSERLALDLSRKSRDVIKSEKYQSLFPEIKLRSDQDTKGYFVNTRGGFRYATGVGGSVTGHHAHFIAVDDPLDPLGSLSTLDVAEANTWMTETLSRRKVDALLTPTVLIMQRLHEDDPTGATLERGTPVRHFVLPCDTTWDIQPPELARFYENGLLDPNRLSRPALEQAEKELGPAGFACQMGQSPIPRGGALFDVSRFNWEKTPPTAWKRGPVRFWDTAGTKKGGAWTVGTKMAIDWQDHPWVLDVRRGQWGTAEREHQIDLAAEADGKKVYQVLEQGAADAGKFQAEFTVKRLTLMGYLARAEKPSGDKEMRADPLSQQVNMGNVYVVIAYWNKDWKREFQFFPRSKYKDQVDSASGAFSHLTRARLRVGAW